MNRQQLLELARAEGHLGAEMMDADKFARHHAVGQADREAAIDEGKLGSRLMNQDRKIREALYNRAIGQRQRQIAGIAHHQMGLGDAKAQEYVRGAQFREGGASYGGSSDEEKASLLLRAAAGKESQGRLSSMLEAAAGPGAGAAALRYGIPALGMTAAGAGLLAIMDNLQGAQATAEVRNTPGAEL